MTTYSIRDFKANVTKILRSLSDDDEVIITRRGNPCGRLTSIPSDRGKPSLATLRGTMANLPQASYEDFLEIKAVWDLPSSELVGFERNGDE